MRACKSCGSPVRNRNISGFCLACYNYANRRDPAPSRTCSQCDKTIDRESKSGKCLYHYNLQRWGDDNPRAGKMAEMREAGATYGEIARHFKLSVPRVFYILNRRVSVDRHDQRTADPFLAQKVVSAAAVVFKTTQKDILSRSRFRQHVKPRHAVAFVLYRHGLSYSAIGRKLHRDHSTIINGIQLAEYLYSKDAWFARGVDSIEAVVAPVKARAA